MTDLPHAKADYSTLNKAQLRAEWSAIYQRLWHCDDLSPMERRALKARVSKLAHHHLVQRAA